jgi:hypothetical protein
MSNDNILYYDDRGTGSGKTWDRLKLMAHEHGRYLYAVDRRDIIAEHLRTLERHTHEAGMRPYILEVHSGVLDRLSGRSVRVEVEALPQSYRSGHVIAFITHCSLKSADLSRFSEWHLIIDEVPSFWDQASLSTRVSAPLLRDLFEIVPQGVGSKLVPRHRIGRSIISEDTLAGPIATLHERASNRRDEVITHLMSWDDLDRSPRWRWYSMWPPGELTHFASRAVFVGAESLGIHTAPVF